MKNIYAEIISIGNEILAGYTINTNSAFIAQELKDIGIHVSWVTTISDNDDEIFSALETANRRAQVIAVTGGLGPTPDDITKATICKYFNTRLVENAQVLEDLKDFIKKRNRDPRFLEINRAQAMVPESSQILRNQYGTAPGLVLKKDNSWFVFMPGVPLEMKNMFKPAFLDLLKKEFELARIETRILRTTGIAESTLHDLLKEEIEAHPKFPFAFLPRQIGVDLRFRLASADAEKNREWLNFINQIRIKANKYIFTEDERSLEEIMVERLIAIKKTISVAESFTGGLLQDWITNVPGSSNVFLGGIVAYSNAAKIAFLDVSTETLKTYGAVSEQTALEMARGIQKRFGSDCSVSSTGIAGPGGGSENKPVGLSFIAARYNDREIVRQFNFGSSREINKMRGAMAGLEMLRRLILKYEK